MNCLFKLRARIVRPSLLCLVLNYCSNIYAAHCAFRQGKIPQVATKVLELAGAPSASWQRQLAAWESSRLTKRTGHSTQSVWGIS